MPCPCGCGAAQRGKAFFALPAGRRKPREGERSGLVDSRFNNPACPVVGVTWHDANAYCAWLTERLVRAGLLEPGMVVRLPLEGGWEKAASWDELHQAKLRSPVGDAGGSGGVAGPGQPRPCRASTR